MPARKLDIVQRTNFQLLTSNEVCDLLRISAKSLQRLRGKKAISFLRISGSVRFRQADVENFLAQRTVVAA
jgi:excisionase family DNA binding protein